MRSKSVRRRWRISWQGQDIASASTSTSRKTASGIPPRLQAWTGGVSSRRRKDTEKLATPVATGFRRLRELLGSLSFGPTVALMRQHGKAIRTTLDALTHK